MFVAKLHTFHHPHNRMRFYPAHSVLSFLILQLILSCHSDSFDKSLHGRFPETVLSRVCSLGIVGVHPHIKVCLQLFDRGIDFLSECNSIELILHGSVKSLTYTVCLRAFRLNLRMINVFHSQIQFILMIFSVSAVFCSSIC